MVAPDVVTTAQLFVLDSVPVLAESPVDCLGIVGLPSIGAGAALLRSADAAMYRAKRTARQEHVG